MFSLCLSRSKSVNLDLLQCSIEHYFEGPTDSLAFRPLRMLDEITRSFVWKSKVSVHYFDTQQHPYMTLGWTNSTDCKNILERIAFSIYQMTWQLQLPWRSPELEGMFFHIGIPSVRPTLVKSMMPFGFVS